MLEIKFKQLLRTNISDIKKITYLCTKGNYYWLN